MRQAAATPADASYLVEHRQYLPDTRAREEQRELPWRTSIRQFGSLSAVPEREATTVASGHPVGGAGQGMFMTHVMSQDIVRRCLGS